MNHKRPIRYAAITLGIILATAFVLVQPTMQASYAQVTDEGAPPFDSCRFVLRDQSADPFSMNTVRVQDIAKTIITEKEIFRCETVQGDIDLLVDVTTVAEILENMTSKTIIAKQAHVISCAKLSNIFQNINDITGDGSVLGCDVYIPDTDFVPVSLCFGIEGGPVASPFPYFHPQEQNTVNKGKIVKTIIAQKEVLYCTFNTGPSFSAINVADSDDKKVEQYIIEEIWEDLRLAPDDTVVQQNVESLRCWTLVTEAFVESCQFTPVPVQEFEPEE